MRRQRRVVNNANDGFAIEIWFGNAFKNDANGGGFAEGNFDYLTWYEWMFWVGRIGKHAGRIGSSENLGRYHLVEHIYNYIASEIFLINVVFFTTK